MAGRPASNGLHESPKRTAKAARNHLRAGKLITILALIFSAILAFVLFSHSNGSQIAPLALADSFTSGNFLAEISELRRSDLENLGLSTSVGTKKTRGAAQDALRDLAQCSSLDCISNMHSSLGNTKFNFPHFMMVGWQKCATTSIYYHLARHPEVLKPFVKEPHFFTSCQRAGAACKVAGGNNERAYIRDVFQVERAAGSGLSLATLDASVDYAQYADEMAERLHSLFPWLKLVFVMRERVGRAMSWKNMMTQKYDKGCRTELSKCLMGSLKKNNYSHPMGAWLRHFPPKQLHVIQFEELAEDPEGCLRRLKLFLGLDPEQPPADLRNVNARAGSSGWEMSKVGYETLVDNAREDARQLLELLQPHGLVNRDSWMRRWEAVWQRNLDTCDAQGNCRISSS